MTTKNGNKTKNNSEKIKKNREYYIPTKQMMYLNEEKNNKFTRD